MPLEIAIPDTSLSDCSDLRQKTIKIGQIARALAVFKVEKILIYETESKEKERRDLNLLIGGELMFQSYSFEVSTPAGHSREQALQLIQSDIILLKSST